MDLNLTSNVDRQSKPYGGEGQGKTGNALLPTSNVPAKPYAVRGRARPLLPATSSCSPTAIHSWIGPGIAAKSPSPPSSLMRTSGITASSRPRTNPLAPGA
jgi:hypothetical protein